MNNNQYIYIYITDELVEKFFYLDFFKDFFCDIYIHICNKEKNYKYDVKYEADIIVTSIIVILYRVS